MTLSKIHVELARSPDFPNGSPLHGFEFIAPLDNDGLVDVQSWHEQRKNCRVVRFWGTDEHELGHLVRKPGGAWAFHYDIHGDEDDDDTGYRFGSHELRAGEYLSIKDHDDDEMHTFKIISVQPV